MHKNGDRTSLKMTAESFVGKSRSASQLNPKSQFLLEANFGSPQPVKAVGLQLKLKFAIADLENIARVQDGTLYLLAI